MPLGSKYLLKVNNKGNKASSLDFLVDNKQVFFYRVQYFLQTKSSKEINK